MSCLSHCDHVWSKSYIRLCRWKKDRRMQEKQITGSRNTSLRRSYPRELTRVEYFAGSKGRAWVIHVKSKVNLLRTALWLPCIIVILAFCWYSLHVSYRVQKRWHKKKCISAFWISCIDEPWWKTSTARFWWTRPIYTDFNGDN